MHLPPWALWLASDCPHPVCAKGEIIWMTQWSEKQPRRLENSTPRTCVSLTLNLGWCPWFATFNNSTELHDFPLNKVQRMMIRYEQDQRIGRTTVMEPSTLWICDTITTWGRRGGGGQFWWTYVIRVKIEISKKKRFLLLLWMFRITFHFSTLPRKRA